MKTFKVISTFKAKNENELTLKTNDYIFSSGNTTNSSTKDNIMKGLLIKFHLRYKISFFIVFIN